MANLSKLKRDRMLAFLDKIRESHKNDDDILVSINEVEDELLNKRYGLVWEEHSEEVEERMLDEVPVFIEEKDKEINNGGESYNFLLEGDNLHSLHLLEKTHCGRVDVIYIDPPYNTGVEFRYDDKRVEKTDGYSHSKWLSFMERRLKIAEKLLSDEGCIFISISDIEMSGLKLLCDDIFGSEHFITAIPRITSKQRSGQEKYMNISHDYVLCYSNSETFRFIVKRDLEGAEIKEDANGHYLEGDTKAILAALSQGYSKGGDYDFEYNGKIYKPITKNGVRNRWLWSKERMEAAAKLGILVETKSSLRMQLYLDKKFDDKTNTLIPKNDKLIFHTADFMNNNAYTNTTGTNELEQICGGKPFPYPKPLTLVKDLVRLSMVENPLVLDFFAGSGTTGQAVLELNKEDGGKRNFILCTNNEDNICHEVTYPRIKTAITGIRADGNRFSDGLNANLKYYSTDFVPKYSNNLTDDLLSRTREMIQLSHHISIDGANYVSVLSDDDADDLEKNWEKYDNIKAIFLSRRVLLTATQSDLFRSKECYVVPDYFFRNELKEAGEA